MKNNSIFLVAVMSILLSACGSTSGTDKNIINDNASATRHVSEGSGDWTDTPSNATPPVLDTQPTMTEGVSSCNMDKGYIYGTSESCEFSIEEFKSGEPQTLKCVGDNVYVNDVLMSNVKLENLMLTCNTPTNTKNITSDLPRFGAKVDPNYPENSNLFIPLAAMYHGILSIDNGCVTVTVGASTKYKVILPIFPPNSKFIKASQSIMVNGVTFSNGDNIAMNASTTTRDFWVNMKPNMPYTPVPEHCQASEYWQINGEGIWLAD